MSKTLHVVFSFVLRAAFLVILITTLSGSMPGNNEQLQSAEIIADSSTNVQIDENFGRMPLYFIENQGQADEHVAYYVQGVDRSLYFTAEGVTIVMDEAVEGEDAAENEPEYGGSAVRPELEMPQEVQRWVLKLDFVGANPDVQVEGEALNEAVISYFRGGPEEWHTGVATYERLVYRNLWEGIDLVFSGTGSQLKYEFVIQPGVDPSVIRLAYRGAQELQVNAEGELEIVTGLETLVDEAPVAWQEIDGTRVAVEAGYRLEDAGDSLSEAKGYGFQVGSYDPAYALVIDPAVIVYAGFIGGSGSDRGYGVAVDADGAAYVVGVTQSRESTFPVNVGPDLTFNGDDDDDDDTDAFIVKVLPDGSGLAYAGYIGGDDYDHAWGVAVGADGAAYVVGQTTSSDTTFPVIVGPDLTSEYGHGGGFIAKVLPDGSGLAYAGYIGGSDNDLGTAIAVDASGAAFVVGSTASDEATFPASVGPDLTYNGSNGSGDFGDVFVAKVLPDGSGLVYAGYIGGSGYESGSGIAVDASGAVYVAGYTESSEDSFPVAVGPDLTYDEMNYGDAFIAKVLPDGSGLVFAGYIGGNGYEWINSVAVDPAGWAYVVGPTGSSEASFPVIGGPDLTYNGGRETFIAKVAPDGSGLAYAGFIGGSGSDWGYGVAVDAIGAAYVVGYTSSSETFFPINGGPDLTYNGGSFDAFIAKVKGEIIPLDVDVQGNGVSIPDGDTTPYLTDDTDFGSVRMLGSGGIATTIFTLHNTGEMNLILDETAVTLSGTNAADFTVTDQPDSPVAPGNSTTFTVVFDPSETGTRSAVINIASTNLDESPFTFAVQGDSNYLLYMPFAGN